ncbi:uncharacterized protein [Anoplolepis gracilipes]|uniref:uncharacterized protein n=1 Tax=Anoplolepis gracilipes TaxID=354296 RepID=UPI003BA18060
MPATSMPATLSTNTVTTTTCGSPVMSTGYTAGRRSTPLRPSPLPTILEVSPCEVDVRMRRDMRTPDEVHRGASPRTSGEEGDPEGWRTSLGRRARRRRSDDSVQSVSPAAAGPRQSPVSPITPANINDFERVIRPCSVVLERTSVRSVASVPAGLAAIVASRGINAGGAPGQRRIEDGAAGHPSGFASVRGVMGRRRGATVAGGAGASETTPPSRALNGGGEHRRGPRRAPGPTGQRPADLPTPAAAARQYRRARLVVRDVLMRRAGDVASLADLEEYAASVADFLGGGAAGVANGDAPGSSVIVGILSHGALRGVRGRGYLRGAWDSYKFLTTSLDKLASFLNKDKLKILQSEYKNLSAEDFNLLTRKGVFPYEYIDCVDKLQDACLPSRESFYSSLTGNTVSESDYAHAEIVWKRFSIRTLGEYSDLYLKIDVLLLADIFENFRESCIKSYGLDPAYYYTLPGYTWDAMLKYTKIIFELLTDIDMVMFIERGIRGGLSQCSNRYARANNKYMQSYDLSKPSTYLMYFDVNNLYGWAMCQPLPYADFQWVDNVSNFDVSSIALDSSTGYILEVDLEYPQHLHDSHTDLPFCPTHDKPPGKREGKLLATVYDKKRYVIHYRNLQQCSRHGLRVTKIHRILQFTQSPWLRTYIELNTKFRTLAKNDFEKNLYKLMNNAVFGKTMENVRNRVDVKLLTKWDGRYGAETLIAKPNFHSRSIFSENLIAVELRKLEVKFYKPIYVGMCILDISKTCLYEFHHDYMVPMYRERCKVMYTDTDSLIYHIECDDVYENMKCDISRFDTSDYATDNAVRLNHSTTDAFNTEYVE